MNITTDYFVILLPLALILILSKVLSKLCEKIGLPGVIGMLVSGILIGLISYIPNQTILNDTSIGGIGFLAKIGVILIMFSAGLGTDIKQIKSVGVPSIIITCFGVAVPLALGFVVACLFNGGFVNMSRDTLLSNLFYGVILTATSVSVTVATLKELGKLSGKVGTTIVAAAIIDDIIGIVILSFIVALKGSNGEVVSPWHVLLMTCLFIVFIAIAGMLAGKFFNFLEHKFPHHRMLPIFSIAFCFLVAYLSEEVFGVADITGAFAAGLFLSRNPEASYIDRKSDIMSYMVFTPVFFCNIGITTKFTGFSTEILMFGLCFILAGIIGKVVGCAGSALLCKYKFKESLCVGIGMMARAEVALVSAQKGVENGLVSSEIMPFIVILIVITSFATPILLKLLMTGDKPENKIEEVKAR